MSYGIETLSANSSARRIWRIKLCKVKAKETGDEKMGTRCIIDVQSKYDGLARLYHHFEGYPENMVPFIRELELWMRSILAPHEHHLSQDPSYVGSAFSQYELNCIKETKAEAEAKGEKWYKLLSSVGSFLPVPDNQPINFDVYWDIEFYYKIFISANPWNVESYEVLRDYDFLAKRDNYPRFPRFVELKPCEIVEESLPFLHHCEICGDLYPEEMMERDHKQPKSRGGKGKPFNRRRVCANCHSYLHRQDKRGFLSGQARFPNFDLTS